MMPLVTVIMPCYNHGEFIREALQSVYEQHHSNYEIIIVDDGSTDEHTKNVLRKLEQEKNIRIIYQENAGPSVARNRGLKHAQGKYIFPLDADNRTSKKYIEAGVAVMEKEESVGVVYGNHIFFGDKNEVYHNREFDLRTLLLYNYIDTCAVIRKRAFDDVGGFDEWMSSKGLEDWDLWIAFAAKGWQFRYLPEVMFEYRVLSNARTFRDALKNQKELIEYVVKKHALFYRSEFEKLFYENKALKNSFEQRVVGKLLAPIRQIKSKKK